MITARRCLLESGLAEGYEPVTLYLGFGQGFPLRSHERRLLTRRKHMGENEIADLLYLRMGVILERLLREVRAGGRGLGVLDAADRDADWVQRMVRFEGSDETLPLPERTELKPLVARLKELQALLGKRLGVLAVVDEVQELDELLPPQRDNPRDQRGGARMALRALRYLQSNVYSGTEGAVALLPIATGTNASVGAIIGYENGENEALGARGDEVLMGRADFQELFTQCAAEARSAAPATGWAGHPLAVAHYPHVREMLHSPLECRMAETDVRVAKVDELVVKAFCDDGMDLPELPMGIVPTRPHWGSVWSTVPTPSFYAWGCIHESLKARAKGLRVDVPFRAVSQDGICGAASDCRRFEGRCFEILAYFLGVFGPIEGYLRDVLFNHLSAPLQRWFPRAAFSLEKKVTMGRLIGRRSRATALLADEMPDVAEDFVAVVLGLSPEVPQAAWFSCGVATPIDFILAVTAPPATPGGRPTLDLRFTDARHTDARRGGSVGLKDMLRRAESLHAAIARGLRRRNGALEVQPFGAWRLMLCHHRADAAMLSPSTFAWEPWSSFLFSGTR
jgi:hypothetical protein